MKSRKLKKIIAVAIVSTTISTIAPNPASAEWLLNADNNWNWMQGGSKATGWKQINGSWYFFDENGKMATGWIKTTDSKWYYLNSDGSMKTGWLYDTDGKWYNLAPSGEMRTGWINDADGSIYFTDSSGGMQTGVIQVEGKSYVLGENGAMLIGSKISFEKGIYTTDDKGVIIEGNTLTDNRTYTKEGVLVIPNTSSNQDTDKATSTVGNSSNNTETSSSSSSNSAKKKISKIDAISDIEVANGTDLDEIGLPTSVYVTLNNNTKRSVTVIWDKGNPMYDGDSEGTYKFTGTIKLPSSVKNPKNLKASVNVHVQAPAVGDKTILSVEKLRDIYVANGTDLDEIGLPSDVDIRLSDNTTTSAAVKWNGGAPNYDGDTAGKYKFTGTIKLPSGVTNPNNVKASINVNVQAPVVGDKPIISVEELSDINVANGTDLYEVGLPSDVDITLSDNTTTSAAVTWDGGTPNYDGNTLGKYEFIGTITLPSGVTNPNNIKASINVNVQAPVVVDKTILSVEELSDINVVGGTDLDEVGLPTDVDITLSDNTTTSAAVTWDGGTPNYDGNTVGKYEFIGSLTLPSGVTNPNNIKASVNVNVQKVLTSVQAVGNITVEYGSELSSLGLPSNLTITLNDNTTESVAVTWDGGTPNYNGDIAGTYTFKGTLNLPSGVSNPNNIKASVNVVVKGLLNFPFSASVDGDGNVYIANLGGGNVIKYDSDGNYQYAIRDGLIEVTGVTVSASGVVYVSDHGNSRIVTYDSQGNMIGAPITHGGDFRPIQVALDSEGNIYVGNNSYGYGYEYEYAGLVKFNPAGQYVSNLGNTILWAVAIDNNNNIYAAYEDGRIYKMNSSGTALATFDLGENSGYYEISEMMCDSSGNLYVLGYDGNIKVIGSNGNVIRTITTTVANNNNGYYYGFSSIALDNENNIYVVDAANNRVVKFDNDGNYIREFK